MEDSLPVIFIHNGRSWYLPYVINQALVANHPPKVVLLSEGTAVEGATNIDRRKYDATPAIVEFKKYYRHMSPNPYEYELFCFLRWFYLLEYMREYKLKRVLYLDSDCLLFSSSTAIEAWVGSNTLSGLSIPEQVHESYEWCVSGHSSYWTVGMLERFCDFALQSYVTPLYLKMYDEKWTKARHGGICDMTALYLFWRENEENIFNMAAHRDGAVFDHNINSSFNYLDGEYAVLFGTKKLIFEDGIPKFVLEKTHEKILAHALHCQGTAKRLIPSYYRGRRFDGKNLLDAHYSFENMKARGIYMAKKTLRPAKRAIARVLGKSLPGSRASS